MDPRLVVISADPVNAETPLDLQRGIITPNHLFFMRNRSRIPEVDPADWTLTIAGTVERPTQLSYEELLALPSRSLLVTLECAGNGRLAMDPPAAGEPWGYGAVSTAMWTGVPLYLLLEAAGLHETTREILFEGTDRGAVDEKRQDVPFARSLPVEKAMHPDTILAYVMNGDPLPVDHGFPIRLIVPGWYGMASVKWLSSIRAIPHRFDGFFQNERYVMLDGSPDSGRPCTAIGVRSIITAPRDGTSIPSGLHIIRGLAWSGAAPVTEIEVTLDGGETWLPATWTSDSARYAWRSWEYAWEAETHETVVLASRATDEAGNVQPERTPWNSLGYSNNAIQTVRVRVE